MKLLTTSEFKALEGDVLYSEYIPRVASGLFIRVSTEPGELGMTLIPLVAEPETATDDQIEDFHEGRISLAADYSTMGTTYPGDNERRYQVYEKHDIRALIKQLQELL